MREHNLTRRRALKLFGMGTAVLSVPASGTAAAEKDKRLPEGADPRSIDLHNDSLSIEVGETGSDEWYLSNTDTLFYEYFALQDGDGDVVPSYRSDELVDEFPETGNAGESYTATARYTVGGTPVRLDRTVEIDQESAAFIIRYEITNTGDGSIGNLNLYQHCDYDIGSLYDNVGVYESSPELTYISNADSGVTAGFTGEATAENHHVGPYPAYDEVSNGNLNNDDRYPNSGSADPVVVLQWALGSLGAGETTSFTVAFGMASSPDRLRELVDGGTGGSIPLRPLIGNKRDRISSLRAEARRTIGDGVVPDGLYDPQFFRDDSTIGSLDEDAEAFLDNLEARLSDLERDERRRYREALERLIAAEDVSIAAAENPNRTVLSAGEDDPTIVEETAGSLVEGALILATVGLFKAAKSAGRIGAAGRLASSAVDDIASHARSMKNTLVDSGYISAATARKIELAFGAVKSQFRVLFSEYEAQTAAAFEESISTGLSEGLDFLPQGLKQGIERLYDGATSLIAKILYEYFVFSKDVVDAEIPTPRSIEDRLPSVDLPNPPEEIPLPDEEIESAYQFIRGEDIDVADSIDISFVSDEIPDRIEITLPDIPELEEVAAVADTLEEGIQSLTLEGVDPSVDEGVHQLESAVREGSLGEQDGGNRETVTSLLAGGVGGITTAAQIVLSGLNIANFAVTIGLIAVLVSVLLVLVTALPSFGWTLSLLPLIGSAAGVLGTAAIVIVAASIATGGGYLSVIDKVHAGGVGLLVGSENFGGVI